MTTAKKQIQRIDREATKLAVKLADQVEKGETNTPHGLLIVKDHQTVFRFWVNQIDTQCAAQQIRRNGNRRFPERALTTEYSADWARKVSIQKALRLYGSEKAALENIERQVFSGASYEVSELKYFESLAKILRAGHRLERYEKTTMLFSKERRTYDRKVVAVTWHLTEMKSIDPFCSLLGICYDKAYPKPSDIHLIREQVERLIAAGFILKLPESYTDPDNVDDPHHHEKAT